MLYQYHRKEYIGMKYLVEVLLGHFRQRCIKAVSGVVDDDIDGSPKDPVYLGHYCLGCFGRLCTVGLDGRRFGSLCGDARDGGQSLVGASLGRHVRDQD